MNNSLGKRANTMKNEDMGKKHNTFFFKQTDDPLKKLGRNALIGFVSSVVSDTTSNSLRVISTYVIQFFLKY